MAVRLPLVVVTLLWLVAMATSAARWGFVVPNSDGNSHGVMTVALLQHGEVLVSNSYPLGVHLVAALVGAATSVPSALVVPLTVLGSIWAVLGVAAFAARISRELVVWVAFAACAVPNFPSGQVFWGSVPLVLAVALVPAVALAVLDIRDPGACLLAAAAVAGLLAIHVTEVFVAALLVLLVLLARPHRIAWPIVNAALAGLGALLLTAPLVAELLGGGAERPQDPSPENSPLLAAVTSIVQPFLSAAWSSPWFWAASFIASGVLVAVSIVGAGAVWGSPHGRAVVLLIVPLLGLSVLALVQTGGPLTVPWYGNGYRLIAQAAALLPIPLGAGFHRLLAGAHASTPARSVAIIAVMCAAATFAQSVSAAQQGLDRYSVVTTDDRLAFAWLAGHVRPGEHVLNDHRDGSVWMVEATAGVDQPLFGAKPGGGFQAYPEWADRVYLRDHVANFDTDPRVRSIATTWGVRYVFSGERTFDDVPPYFDADTLAKVPGVIEVFRSGGARVFELPGS